MNKLIKRMIAQEKKWQLLDLKLSIMELKIKEDKLDKRLKDLGV